MQTLRRLVRFGFGLQALAMIFAFWVAMAAVVAMSRAAEGDGVPIPTLRLMMSGALILSLLCTLPVTAWWMIKKSKPSARRWALAASAFNMLILVAGIDAWRRMHPMRTWPFYVLCGVTGIIGLIGFWRNENPVERRRSVRVAGDGTSKIKDHAAQGISIGIVWLSAGWWSTWANRHGLPYPGLMWFLAQMELAVLLTTFAHELGHLVAGWASHKALRFFHVGPFRWGMRNGAWRFDFNLRKFYGGSVGMVAPDLVNVRSRKAFSLMGGPVASLVTGSIFIVVALLAPGRTWQNYWPFLSMMATFSISAFIVNLIPLKPESNYSDGAQLYQVVTNGPWARVHFALAMVTAGLVSLVRPRDFDVDVINEAGASVPHGERGLLLRLFACHHYIDKNEIPKAVASMQQAEGLYDGCKFERTQDICADFVFLNAFFKRDLAAAEMWWKRMEALRKIDADADYLRAQSALHWLRGERAAALSAWDRGYALASKLPKVGAYDFTRSCFAKLRAELDAPVRMSPPPLDQVMALAGACEGEPVGASL